MMSAEHGVHFVRFMSDLISWCGLVSCVAASHWKPRCYFFGGSSPYVVNSTSWRRTLSASPDVRFERELYAFWRNLTATTSVWGSKRDFLGNELEGAYRGGFLEWQVLALRRHGSRGRFDCRCGQPWWWSWLSNLIEQGEHQAAPPSAGTNSPPNPGIDAIQTCKLVSDVPGLATFEVQYAYNALRPGAYAIKVNIYSTGTGKGPKGPGTVRLLSSAQTPVSKSSGVAVVDVQKDFESSEIGFVEFQLVHENGPLRVKQSGWNVNCDR